MVRYLGPTDPLNVIHGKIYPVVGVEDGGKMLAIIDEDGEECGYLYSSELFEVVGQKKAW